MFDLSAEQRSALESAKPVSCVVERTECVVVRKDVFERVQHVVYDDGEITSEEMIVLAENAFDDADTAGPIP